MHKPIKWWRNFPFYCLTPWKWPNWGGNRTRGQDMYYIMKGNSSLFICGRSAQRVRCINRSDRERNFPFFGLPPWIWPKSGGNRTRGQDMYDIMKGNSSLFICGRSAQRVRCINRSDRERNFPFFGLPPWIWPKSGGNRTRGQDMYDIMKGNSSLFICGRSAQRVRCINRSDRERNFPFFGLPPWIWPKSGGNRTRGQDMYDIMKGNSSLFICGRSAQRVRCINRSDRERNFPFFGLPPWIWPKSGGNRTRGQDMYDIMKGNSSLFICGRSAQRVRCINRSDRERNFPFFGLPPWIWPKSGGNRTRGQLKKSCIVSGNISPCLTIIPM